MVMMARYPFSILVLLSVLSSCASLPENTGRTESYAFTDTQETYLSKKVQAYRNLGKTGDGFEGWEEHAPYDAIIVTCAPTHIPQPLKDQLKEGGKMIIPVGEESHTQQLILVTKINGKVFKQKLLAVRFVPFTGKALK